MSNVIYTVDCFGFSYPLSKKRIQINGDFSINQGEHILLTGNSGSGKSTLLMALKGLIPNYIRGTYSGNISYRGKNIAGIAETELIQIGYLQQNPDHQVIYQTVIDELAFGLENLQLTPQAIQDKIDTYTEIFGITHLLTRKISTLSGGEKQKINLISILLTEPEVLLLDEPTAFLDTKSAHQIFNVLKTYATDKTVIIIDHNQHYYKNFVNRIINIANNQIEEINLDSHKWHNDYPANQVAHNSNEILLNIRNLSFAYKDVKDNLLNNICLKVHKGEITVISGKNGNGKSTLLKLIAKLIPSQNSIFLQNDDIANIKQKDYWQQVSLLWQNPENHFLFNSVAEELKNNPELINTFGLTEQIHNNPYCLSEGQKRRLSLAITLLKPRQLILLDEPTFGQDFANKVILLEITKQLAKLGHSFIIISHDEEFNHAVAHSRYVLKDGQLWRE